jgi:hypothetical protein
MIKPYRLGWWEYCLIFSKILGTTLFGVGLFLIRILTSNRRYSLNWYLILIFLLSPYIIVALLNNPSSLPSVFSNLLYYFIFLLLYPEFSKMSSDELVERIYIILKINFYFTLVEFVVLQSPMGNKLWYFPMDHPHRALVLGIQKSLGLGSLSSVSGFISAYLLILLLEFTAKPSKKSIFMTIATLIMLMSGTGFFLLIFYYIYRIIFLGRGRLLYYALPIGIMILMAFSGINKFTITYFLEIIDVKIFQLIEATYFFDPNAIFFGKQIADGSVLTSGDFGYINAFFGIGVFGLIFLLFLPLVLLKESKYILFLLTLLSLYHYPSLSGGVGGYAYALAIALSAKSPNK